MDIKKTITCKLDPTNAKRLDKLAKAIGMTRSELVAHCIALGLNQGEYIADRFDPPTSANLLRLQFNADQEDPIIELRIEELWKNNQKRYPEID